jgi:extracellular matrix regulatory protein A
MAQAHKNGTGTELVHVGFGNFLAINKVLAIVTPNSAPIQRMVREGKKERNIIDITSGRRTKAAVIMEDGKIALVAITPEALAGRVVAAKAGKSAQALGE